MIKCQEMRKDNRGIALISVMICATLCLLLSATILRVSLLSYRQKAIGKQSASTFYENEVYVDDIKMGLQAKVAEAFAESSTTSRTNFVTNFKAQLLADGGTSLDEKIKLETALTSYLTGYNPSSTIKDITVKVDGFTDGDGDTKYFDESVAGEIVIKNVRISYTDLAKGGYISEIKTDIRIRSPYVSQSTPGGGGYSMFAGSGFSIPATAAKPAMLTIEGDIYIGYDPDTEVMVGGSLDSAVAMTWSKYNSVYWPADASVTVNGDVRLCGMSNLVILSKDVDVRGTIYVSESSNLVIAKDAVVKCRDIVVECPEKTENQNVWFDIWTQSVVASVPADAPQGRYEKRNMPVLVTDWAGGKSLSGNYNSGYADVEKHLPTYAEENDKDLAKDQRKVYWHNKNDQNNGSGLYVWDASTSTATRINKKSALSSIPGLTIDSSNKVHPRVKRTINSEDYYFDEEYVTLVDVDYFIPYAVSAGDHNTASKVLSDDDYTPSGTKFIANNGTTMSSLSSGGGYHQTYDTGNGGHDIVVFCGKIETLNRSDGNGQSYHFAIGYKDFTVLNDQNGNAQSIGVYITPAKISCTSKEGASTVKALAEVATDSSYAQAFFDGLGKEVMGISGVDIDHQTINNFFVGGIAVFYSDESSSTGGGGQQITNTDKTMNASLDIISFENWEKNPVTNPTTS